MNRALADGIQSFSRWSIETKALISIAAIQQLYSKVPSPMLARRSSQAAMKNRVSVKVVVPNVGILALRSAESKKRSFYGPESGRKRSAGELVG